MFNFNSLKKLETVKFDGKTPYNVIVRDVHVYDVGEYNENTEAIIRILAEEETTRTPIKWNVKFVGIAPRYFTDPETGVKTQYDSERVSACKALSRGLGIEYTNDIEELYQHLDGACLRVLAKEEIVRNEDGEPLTDESGLVRVWYKVKILAPASAELKGEENMAKRINSDNIAKAEAKRARKGQRGYAGNTGEA